MSRYKYTFPELFKRLHNGNATKAKQLETLRNSKLYRYENKSILVQGFHYIKELRDLGFEFRSLIATAKKDPREDQEVGYPSKQVIQHPDGFPAKKYYLTDVDLTRKILGTASRPQLHEVYAEVEFPEYKIGSGDRYVVFDKVNNNENLGALVRTARGLGWHSGIVTTNNSDLYHDGTIRASKLASITWPHKAIGFDQLSDFFKEHKITPVVAEILPDEAQEAWSPDYGHANTADVKPGSGVWFWNFGQKRAEIPKRVALVLSCEHHGVHSSLKDAIRVSIPLERGVHSLNVECAGSIIMTELSRQRATK